MGGVFSLENYGTESNPITISGTNGGTLSGETGKRVMYVGGNSHLRFENITFTGAVLSSDNGGALYIDGESSKVTLDNGARIRDNTAKHGGGIYVKSGNLIIDGAEITNNTAVGSNGGALYAESGSVTIKSGLFTVNKATSVSYVGGDGGGVYVTGNADFTMTRGTDMKTAARITANTAENNGGGIYIAGGTAAIRGAAITRNTAGAYGYGGGVYVSGGTLTVDGAEISENKLTGYGYGGGLCVYNSSATVPINVTINPGTTIRGNSAGHGGGIYIHSYSLSQGVIFTMNGANVSGNTATNDRGGGVCVWNNTVVQITGGAISGNQSIGGGLTFGGGINISGGNVAKASTVQIGGGCVIKENEATRGGGINMDSNGFLTVDGAEIKLNRAVNGFGGGFYIVGPGGASDAEFTLKNAIIDSNEAVDKGGGLYVKDNFVLENTVKITNNKASGGNAGKGDAIWCDGGSVSGAAIIAAGGYLDGDLP